MNWELELFDIQPAQTGGLDHEFIFAGRIDDKLCSWAAIQALLNTSTERSSQIKMVALFDDEEVGSLLRQGVNNSSPFDVIHSDHTRLAETSFPLPSSASSTSSQTRVS